MAEPVIKNYKDYSNLFVYSGANKAGMEGIDKEKQAQIIYEMSKNSAYFKKAAKADEATDEKVKIIQKNVDCIGDSLRLKLTTSVTQNLIELEKKRNFSQICCVLDMDMFYAAVEIRDQPHLADKPVAVGGDMMISTANYVARKYGVRAAMPGFVARKLCPHLVFVGMNFKKYELVAEQIRGIIGEYDPDFRSHSLDEVYFDLTTAAEKRWADLCESERVELSDIELRSHEPLSTLESEECHSELGSEHCGTGLAQKHLDVQGNAAKKTVGIVELRKVACVLLGEIRQRIKEVTGGLTASAGIANNFFLAKICADINKPDGQFELGPSRQQVMDFVTPLATRKVGGIGKVTEKVLSKLGMSTLGEVRANLHLILHAFSTTSYDFLARVSLGIADEEGCRTKKEVPSGAVTRKSIGCERTFSAKGISDPAELYAKLHHICENVNGDMVSENLWGRGVTLKLKTVTFELVTRIATAKTHIQHTEDIERLAKQLLDAMLPVSVRLMGVSVSKFRNAYDPDASGCNSGGVRRYFQPVRDDGGHSNSGFSHSGHGHNRAEAFELEDSGEDTHTGAETGSMSAIGGEIVDLLLEEKQQGQRSSLFDTVLRNSQQDFAELSRSLSQQKEDCGSDLDRTTVFDVDEEVGCDKREGVSLHCAVNLSDKASVVCPICSQEVYGTVVALNKHIDACLLGEPPSHKAPPPISGFFAKQQKSSVSSVSSSSRCNAIPTRGVELDEDGFERYDPRLFDSPSANSGEVRSKRARLLGEESSSSAAASNSRGGGITKYLVKS